MLRKNILKKFLFVLIALFTITSATSCVKETEGNVNNSVRRVISHGSHVFNDNDVVGRIRIIVRDANYIGQGVDQGYPFATIEIINDTDVPLTIAIENALEVNVPNDEYWEKVAEDPSFMTSGTFDGVAAFYFTKRKNTISTSIPVTINKSQAMELSLSSDESIDIAIYDTIIDALSEHLGDNHFLTLLAVYLRQNNHSTQRYLSKKEAGALLSKMTTDWVNSIPTSIRDAILEFVNFLMKVVNGEFRFEDLVTYFNTSYQNLLAKIKEFKATPVGNLTKLFFEELKTDLFKSKSLIDFLDEAGLDLINYVASCAAIFNENLVNYFGRTTFGGVVVNQYLYKLKNGDIFNDCCSYEIPLTYKALKEVVDYYDDQDYYNVVNHNSATVATEAWNIAAKNWVMVRGDNPDYQGLYIKCYSEIISLDGNYYRIGLSDNIESLYNSVTDFTYLSSLADNRYIYGGRGNNGRGVFNPYANEPSQN